MNKLISSPSVHLGRWPTLLICIGAAAAITLPRLSTAQIVDNFDDGDDVGWTQYDPIGSLTGLPQNTWTFPNGTCRLRAAATPSATLGPARIASFRQDQIAGDFQLTVDLVGWDANLTQAMGLVARVQPNPGPGTTDGYIFGFVSGATPYAQIVRLRDEGTFSIVGSSPAPIVLDPAKAYRLFFQGRGDKLEARIYELPNLAQPILALNAVDNAYTEGTAGLIAFSLNRTVPEKVDVTFDNYYGLDAVPPSLEIQDLGFGLIHVLWPGEAAAFRLEGSATLPGSLWTEVNELDVAYFADIDRYVYQHDASEGNRFFRLRRP